MWPCSGWCANAWALTSSSGLLVAGTERADLHALGHLDRLQVRE